MSIVRNLNRIQIKKELSFEAIIKAVSSELNIEKELIISSGKSQKGAYARKVLVKIAVDMGKIPINTLAEQLNRHPSTLSGMLSNFNIESCNCISIKQQIQIISEKAFEIQESNV